MIAWICFLIVFDVAVVAWVSACCFVTSIKKTLLIASPFILVHVILTVVFLSGAF